MKIRATLRGLGMFVGKIRTITRPGSLVFLLESYLSISEANECPTDVNIKRNQQAQM